MRKIYLEGHSKHFPHQCQDILSTVSVQSERCLGGIELTLSRKQL